MEADAHGNHTGEDPGTEIELLEPCVGVSVKVEGVIGQVETDIHPHAPGIPISCENGVHLGAADNAELRIVIYPVEPLCLMGITIDVQTAPDDGAGFFRQFDIHTETEGGSKTSAEPIILEILIGLKSLSLGGYSEIGPKLKIKSAALFTQKIKLQAQTPPVEVQLFKIAELKIADVEDVGHRRQRSHRRKENHQDNYQFLHNISP